MGGLASIILDPIGSILGTIWDFMENFTELAWNGLKKWIVEPVMNFLGFTDEDVYSTDIIAVSVFDDELFHKTRVDLHLEYMKHGLDSLQYITNFSKTGDNQFNKFYRSGKWDFMDYLPEAQINAMSIPVDKVIAIIEEQYDTPIFLIDIMFMTPFDKDWVIYYLQENYNYKVGEDNLKYTDNYWYKFSNISYNTATNTFNTTLSTIDIIDIKTYKVTTTTITPIDASTDNKNVTVYEEVLYVRKDTGSVLERVSTELSNTNTTIPSNTEVDSVVNILTNQEDRTIPTNTIYIEVPNHNNERVYVVKYSRTNTGEIRLWMYNPNDNIHSELSSPSMRITELEMLPIVMVRNNHFNIDEYDVNSKKIDDEEFSRPPSVTEKRYKDTKKILNNIGVDVATLIEGYSQNPDIENIQDGFVMMGIAPADTSPIVSKALYEMFDYIYDGLPPTTDTAYAASFRENPYNSSISWLPLPTKIKSETIGMLGDCSHTVTKSAIIRNTYKVREVTTIYPISRKGLHLIRKRISEYTVLETVYEDEVLSSSIVYGEDKVSAYGGSPVTSTVVYTDELDGIQRELTDTETNAMEQIIVKKQITLTQTKIFTAIQFQGFTIIRRGVKNGGKVLPPSDKNLVIPLAMDIVRRLTILEKTALLGRSVYLIFYAIEHTHLRWYETESFAGFLKFLTIVIVIVVSIVSFGSLTGPTITLTSVLLNVLQSVIIGVALQLALKMIMKFVNNVYLKMALSAIAMIAAIYFGGGFTSFDALSAMQLLQIPTMAADIFVKDKQMSLQKDVSDYMKQQEQYSQKNKQNEQLLQSINKGLTPYDMVDLTIRTGAEYFERDTQGDLMSPSQFYYVATTAYLDFNVLYTGLYDSTIHSFVANKLTLGVAGE